MALTDINSIRNIAVAAHARAGKTSLVEAMLFNAGAITRLGRVEDGNTVTDFDQEEIDRQMTISSSLAHLNYNSHKISIVDTPGFINLLEDAKGGMKAADGLVLLEGPHQGLKGETEKLWKFAGDFGIPKLIFINKMDREGADFYPVLDEFEKAFSLESIPLLIPIGSGESFSGVVDLMKMKAYTYQDGKKTESEIPPDLSDTADKYRKKLIEKVAESDDSLLEKYLEGGDISSDEIEKGVKLGVLTGKFMPVLCGSAVKNIGVDMLMDYIILCLPSPAAMAGLMPIKGKNPKDGTEAVRMPAQDQPFSAYVFKTIADPYAGKLSMFRVYSGSLNADSTVYNSSTGNKERIGQVFYLMGKKQIPAQSVGPGEIAVVAKLKGTNTGDTLCDETNHIVFDRVSFAEPLISYAIEPKSKGDEDKVSTGIAKILEEDPTLRFHRDEEAKEMQISGMGQVHLEITLDKLKRKFGVEVVMKSPKIPYRETIKASAKAQGRYKKQSGGKGQYGDCWIEIKPLPRGTGYEFVDKIVGGSIPRQYIPAVDKGIQEALKEGIYAGYQMVDVQVAVYDGSYHAVDSSEMAFKIAGSFAIKKAVAEARPIVLEPVMKVEVTVPEESLGAIIGDLNTRRGKVHGMDQQGHNQIIGALVPMAEMLTYANQLHSLTAGRGIYHMEFSHYEEVPAHIAQKLIEEKKKKEEE